MGRKPKCQICKIEIDKEKDDWVKNSVGYFHRSCKERRDSGKRPRRHVGCLICGRTIDTETEPHLIKNGGAVHIECSKENPDIGCENSVNCYYCGGKVLSSKVVNKNGKNFHENCVKEYQDRTLLFDYCCTLWGLQSTGPLINNQSKRFREQGYSYKGMLYSLKYFYEIRKNDKNKYKANIGIIPYVYKEAEQYYLNLAKQKREIAQQGIEQQNQTHEVVKVKKQTTKKTPLYEF